ncbi:xanthine permease [Nitzschia inconspicua]|uniref:Xanthine permease n=1 Tax=Nitzschia inconspicua TaxID=303405 RepID=A0A9K3M1W8_9STRA|nr:xanthine permease [Nitzschia inconspicua]KAG7372407.1 xanthine permease [Nitzschia inconspicua]
MTFKSSWLGEGDRYNYGQLCVPTYPCRKTQSSKINFYSKDEQIPYLLALLMGLQHCFAMVGGLITPPLVIFRFTVCDFPGCPDLETYAVSAALIASGVCSLLNLSKFKVPYVEKLFGRDMYVGSGILSVMGTSFTFLPIFEIAINQMKNDGWDGRSAYGAMLGTSMVCCLFELAFSLMPISYIKRLFPPQITSITVILLGIALTGTGMKYWGGGVVCAEMGWKTHQQVINANVTLPPPFATCNVGETSEYYGTAAYVGLGFTVLVSLVIIELFGSVFMRNCNVIIALLIGYAVAAFTRFPGGERYVTNDNIVAAAPVTFVWVETFPLSFYPAAVVPLVIAYLVTTVETVGDISATFEASQLDTTGDFYSTSLQGGLSSDGLCSIISGLMTSMPNTTFSQNNGVISLTKCASRRAGFGAAFWMIVLGVFGKFAGVITAIPDCVLGGMTIFLFANVLVSGINLTSNVDLNSRRNKFIMALSLAIGAGVTVWPYAFQDMRASPYTAAFWTCADCSTVMKGVRNGVSIFLSTGYCVGTVIAMLLNAILPGDAPVAYDDHDTMVVHKEKSFYDDEERNDVKKETPADGSEESDEKAEPEAAAATADLEA